MCVLLIEQGPNQHTQEVKNERVFFLISTRQNKCATVQHTLPLTKRQTDIKQEMRKTRNGKNTQLNVTVEDLKSKAPSLAKMEFGSKDR